MTRRSGGLRGNVDGVFNGKLCGWVFDGTARRIEVVAKLDGVEIASGVADEARADLAESGIGDGHHAFALNLAPEASFQLGASIQIVDIATGNAVARKVSRKRFRHTLGRVDAVDGGTVRGWIYLPWQPGLRPTLELRQGKNLLSTTTPRDFLTGLPGVGSGRYGFSFAVEGGHRGPLSVRCVQSGWEQSVSGVEEVDGSVASSNDASTQNLRALIAENAMLRERIERDQFEIDTNLVQLRMVQAELEHWYTEYQRVARGSTAAQGEYGSSG